MNYEILILREQFITVKMQKSVETIDYKGFKH